MSPGHDRGVSETILRTEPSASEAVPGDDELGVTLRNGAAVLVRPIRPDDESRLMALCLRLSPPHGVPALLLLADAM